ncbi:hypothetical protein [Ammoniphilus sp. 3BR4]|uniref:hypothetical protein n=1 Tax=Ammoniphilus sp. 3BR4 TaxID=3158265 RepID=UPI0034659098
MRETRFYHLCIDLKQLDKLTAYITNKHQNRQVVALKVHARIVIEAKPEVKQMITKIKEHTGKSIKDVVENLICQEYQRLNIK